MKDRGILICLGVLLVSGCATMNEEECRVADWHTVGYEDGARGALAETIGQHRKACADHGIAPDFNAYREGRAEGLKQFCRSQNGFNLGSRGGAYHGVCPAELEPDFLDAYNHGRTLHELESNVSRIASQIAYRERELDDLKHDIEHQGLELITGDMTSEERAQLLLGIKTMAERKGVLKREIRNLYHERGVYEQELEEYRASLAYNY